MSATPTRRTTQISAMNNPDTYLQFHDEDAPVQHIALLE
jgi:hypothetical protein